MLLTYRHHGGKVSTGYLTKNAKEIIHASDRYGIPYLKLEAEACLVEMTVFSEENVLDLLLLRRVEELCPTKGGGDGFHRREKSGRPQTGFFQRMFLVP
jgi:hypothetical protein